MDMDLPPQNNGNTQPFVDNSVTSNLHRNVRKSGFGCRTLAPRDSGEEMGTLCRDIENLNLNSPVEDTSEIRSIPYGSQGRAQESNGNTSNLRFGCRTLAPRDSGEEMGTLCRDIENLNLNSPVEDTSEIRSIPYGSQGRAQESNGNTSNLRFGCRTLAPRDSGEEMGTLCRDIENLNLNSPVEDTSEIRSIPYGSQGRAQESNGNTSNLRFGCRPLTPRDNDDEMEDMDTSDDSEICEISSFSYEFQGPVEEDMDTSDDPEIYGIQGLVLPGTQQSLSHLLSVYSTYPIELAIGYHGILTTAMFERYAVFLSDGNIDKLYGFILMEYAVFQRKILTEVPCPLGQDYSNAGPVRYGSRNRRRRNRRRRKDQSSLSYGSHEKMDTSD